MTESERIDIREAHAAVREYLRAYVDSDDVSDTQDIDTYLLRELGRIGDRIRNYVRPTPTGKVTR